MSNKILKSCPFCDGKAKIIGLNFFWVVCTQCDAESNIFDTKEEAIEHWNTRKPIENIVKTLEYHAWWTDETIDENGFGEGDSVEVINLVTAKRIVKKEGKI